MYDYCDLFMDLAFSSTDLQEWQKTVVRNAIKAKQSPILCRPRCRWRQRESRRRLEGLSSQCVVLDEEEVE